MPFYVIPILDRSHRRRRPRSVTIGSAASCVDNALNLIIEAAIDKAIRRVASRLRCYYVTN